MRLMQIILFSLFSLTVYAQEKITIKPIHKESTQPIPASVRIQETGKGIAIDSTGFVILMLTKGSYHLTVSSIGFVEKEISINILSDTIITVALEPQEEEMEEIIVQSTRTSRTIQHVPTRVEIISGEELEEKANMKPGDIRMMLSESTGIQTQQTSATSYNSSIRIQGLDGRYTQILRDGYPLYSGFSGGLSIMQIAPLDLKQVEVIKGSASTLYGGGAIAGLINLISKTPKDKREISVMTNVTSAKGLDVSAFYSQKFNKVGVTVFGSSNTSQPYDPANIGFTAIPKFERYTVNPRLFLYGKNTTADVGFAYITENRIGGSMDYIKNDTSGYFEKNNTDRFTTQLGLNHSLNNRSHISFKNSYARFNRSIVIPSYTFKGLQHSSFTELSYSIQKAATHWIVGTNLLTDNFKENKQSVNQPRDYSYNTYGVFIQNTWSPLKKLTLETGLRGDYVKEYGVVLLPRMSALFKFSSVLTARLGGGFGYKTPTIFTEEAERMQFNSIQPINENAIVNERSLGGNFDVNYSVSLGKLGCSINQLFFYTYLNKPLILTSTEEGLEFQNANEHIDTRGMETNIKFSYHDFKLFFGYTYLDVNKHLGDSKSWLPLTARHRINNVLMYEKEEKLKIGLEAYYVSRQKLQDGSFGKCYWITGFMVEKLWKHFSVFINFENFTDTRQTKFDSIFTGSINNPSFKDIYAPVEGFVANGGFKVKL